jgi:hypothetical protein
VRKVFKTGVYLTALTLTALGICSCRNGVYVYARPALYSIEEMDGEIEVRWESMNPVTTITRYKWNDLKAGWDFEFEDRVTSSFNYVDTKNLITGNVYGYVVYDDIEYSLMRSIKYKGSDTKKEEAKLAADLAPGAS